MRMVVLKPDKECARHARVWKLLLWVGKVLASMGEITLLKFSTVTGIKYAKDMLDWIWKICALREPFNLRNAQRHLRRKVRFASPRLLFQRGYLAYL